MLANEVLGEYTVRYEIFGQATEGFGGVCGGVQGGQDKVAIGRVHVGGGGGEDGRRHPRRRRRSFDRGVPQLYYGSIRYGHGRLIYILGGR